MENIEIYGDSQVVSDFFDETCAERLKEAVPTLNTSNIRYIARYYRRLKKCPTYGELRLFGELLSDARHRASGILISGLGTDSIALIETYRDMLDKAEAILGKRPSSLTLGESAEVLGEYMRMIGRYDCRSFAAAPLSASGEGECCLICDGSAVMTLGEGARSVRKRRRIKEQKYLLFLVKNDEKGRDFLSTKSTRRCCKSIVRVGEGGLVGLIAKHCEGLCIDTKRLSEDTPVHSLLTVAYRGDYVAFVEYARAKSFKILAGERETAVCHFADTNKSGIIKGRSINIPIELVRRLSTSRRESPSYVPEVDASATGHSMPVAIRRADKEEIELSGRLALRRGRLVSAFSLSPEKNAFALTLNAYVEAVLRLVASGVDRRAICSAAVYETEEKNTDPEALGESLAMILGAYRVGVELAVSEGYTEVRYGDRRRLSCALYASEPRQPVSAKAVGGNSLCFLALDVGEDGLVDFASLRRICDRFIALGKAGRIVSARAVLNEPSAVIAEMAGSVGVELTDNGQIIANTPSRGILFETTALDIDEIIGRTVISEEDGTEEL